MERPVSVLLDGLEQATVLGTPPSTVHGLTADSRRVGPGDCFVAVPGFKEDARRFVPDAVARGASLVVTEGPPLPGVSVAQVLVPSARRALAHLADAWYGHPSRAMTVVGITGTNGKTTTSYLVEALLRAQGLRTGLLGTIQYVLGDEVRPATQTTPEAPDVQSMLATMFERGVRGVAMEVSSHALALSRVDGLDFDVAVFTNLTQDHLDFHGTLDAYRRAKRRLFELLAASRKRTRVAVIGADDPSAAAMVAGLDLTVITFGLGIGAAIRALEYVSSLDGLHLTVDTPRGRVTLASALIGEHNVMNLLAAVGVGQALGLPLTTVGRALSAVVAVPGRFEQIRAGQPFLVVIDYAHTPDALERVLRTARKITPGRLGVVFGCGGDRDRGKRPLMGAIAAGAADRAWVTSDNPRGERAEAIIEEVLAGVRGVAGAASRVEHDPDREAAIRAALRWARAGDTVVIAGKGHETSQVVGSAVLPFDDREVARRLLAERTS